MRKFVLASSLTLASVGEYSFCLDIHWIAFPTSNTFTLKLYIGWGNSSLPSLISSPMSVVVSAKKEEEQTLNGMIKSAAFPSRVRVIPYIAENEKFPINTLRNLAMDSVRTTHVLITDLDILPARKFLFHLFIHLFIHPYQF